MSITQATTTRHTSAIAGLLLSLAIAVLFGTALAPDAAADKKKKPKAPTVAERTENQRNTCETGDPPGTLAVLDGPDGGNTTECKGGSDDGWTCYNTKKATECHDATPAPPPSPLNGTTAPPTGGIEDPAGGANPGGGAGWDDPSYFADQPMELHGGGVVLTSYDGDQHDQAKHDGKRKHRRHGTRTR